MHKNWFHLIQRLQVISSNCSASSTACVSALTRATRPPYTHRHPASPHRPRAGASWYVAGVEMDVVESSPLTESASSSSLSAWTCKYHHLHWAVPVLLELERHRHLPVASAAFLVDGELLLH
ncbi:hypothetical protein B0H10DRAFT_2427450 [Mycena sp. CBHHK59/15]|nr:hypothetical protein B0H10DRAFT_2427450 [Mycena sp. CBHHK59/15]